MTSKRWAPDRRDMIWINCNPQAGRKNFHPLLVLSPKAFNERTGIVIGLPMTTAENNATNPFALRIDRPGKKTSYILVHQPKSFDWRVRDAKPHPLKQAPEDVFALACRALNQIIEIGA
ncbi:MAG: type II toxin-antitoxin system PemK/MazF family toxin [Bryobacterales bacterium]|nr:type II toxin-antitoxin system PemK/MazF family toxin [Bryobacterales bacterium]